MIAGIRCADILNTYPCHMLHTLPCFQNDIHHIETHISYEDSFYKSKNNKERERKESHYLHALDIFGMSSENSIDLGNNAL